MISFKNSSKTAIVVLHEIHGINQHILDVCKEYSSLGYDVYCPNLLGRDEPYSYSQQKEAYAHFMNEVGFGIFADVDQRVKKLSLQYSKIFLVGFSVGATIAWCCAKSAVSGIVCHYGSRIRDYLTLKPECPALLIMAKTEQTFTSVEALTCLSHAPNITLEILDGEHGFCDPYANAYNTHSASEARELAHSFIQKNSVQTGSYFP